MKGAAMDASILKYIAFIKTVECGSFTKAAELLNYSQSGISRMINDLENEWKVTLLERSRAGVRLTSDGLRLLPCAKRVCEEYRKLQTQVDDLNCLRTGIIRIGIFSSVATHRLPRIISRFRLDYPNIDYELLTGDYSEIEGWISDGRVDCGFLCAPTNRDFDVTILERDEFMAVLPENHRLCGLSEVPVSELCGEPFMLLEKSGKCEVSEIFERCGLTPDVKFTTWDDYAIMSMVESGLGISILPNLILKRIPYKIAVKRLNVPAYRDICFAVRDKKTASLAVKRFSEYLWRENGG